MELTHHFSVPTGIDETWAHFQDVAGLAGCFPGAQVTSVEGDSFTGTCKVKLGPIALLYTGTGTFRERDEVAHRFLVEAKGKDKRGNGTANATATLTMTAGLGGGTDVQVLTDLAITGKPAQFGRGLIQEVSDKLLGQFVACLQEQLTPAADAPADAAADAAADPTPPDVAVEAPVADPVAAGPAVASPPARAAGPARPAPRPAEALDLGAAVLPVLVRSYWKPVAAGLLALAVVIRLVRR
jgi:uncharacterized protein